QASIDQAMLGGNLGGGAGRHLRRRAQGLENDDFFSGPRKFVGGGQSHDAGADDDHVGARIVRQIRVVCGRTARDGFPIGLYLVLAHGAPFGFGPQQAAGPSAQQITCRELLGQRRASSLARRRARWARSSAEEKITAKTMPMAAPTMVSSTRSTGILLSATGAARWVMSRAMGVMVTWPRA